MNGASGTAATLTAGGNNGSTTLSGTLINGDTGALGLVKTGTGTLSRRAPVATAAARRPPAA